jgi:hypothetical protein
VKTQIIQLEPHDDTLSVRDKMDWSQTPRVLLVWPEKGKVLRARLDLILLERYCSSHGSQLAVLTSDKEVIYQAGESGIPVFQSRSEAQLQPWRKSFREFRRQDLEKYAAESLPVGPLEREPPQPRVKFPLWVRIPIFTLGVVSVLTLAAFLFPSAKVSILPKVRQQSLSIPIQTQPGRNQITLSGTVPARELYIIVEGQLSTPATGAASIPANYARGEVIFTNLGEDEITIPQDTILSTGGDNPVLFRTLTGGSTPPEQGGQFTMEVEAYLPGESGNIPANQITNINLEVGAELTVTNPLPTEGGTDIHIPAPTLVDKLKLTQDMTHLLKEIAGEEIEAGLGSEDILLTNRLNKFENIREEFSPQGGAPGELLWLDKSVQYLVYYVSADDLYNLASDLVKAQYQDSSYIPDLNSIQLLSTSPPEKFSEGNYQWEMQVSWVDSQTVSEEEISEWISGESLEEAEKLLLINLDLEEVPQIILQPGWWPRVPALPFRIQVTQGGN